jgi:hypothetical protein
MNKLNDKNDEDNDAIAENEIEKEEEDDDMDILWNVQADIQTAADLTTVGAVAPQATKVVDIVCEDAIVASFVVAIQSHDDVETTTTTLAAVSEPCLATWQPVPLLLQPPPSPPRPVPPLPAN